MATSTKKFSEVYNCKLFMAEIFKLDYAIVSLSL